MFDYSSENVIPLSDVPKQVPGRPSLRTVWRWTEKRRSRAKLETMLVGGPASYFSGSCSSLSPPPSIHRRSRQHHIQQVHRAAGKQAEHELN
jgi:hypothetical protein